MSRIGNGKAQDGVLTEMSRRLLSQLLKVNLRAPQELQLGPNSG